MVIHPNNDLTSNTSTHSRHKANSTGGSTAVDKATDNSSNHHSHDVHLSPQAHTYERLESKIQASSGIDTAKVDLIKQQIADGSYEINSASIADKLLKQDDLLA